MEKQNQTGTWLIAIIVGISIAVIAFFAGGGSSRTSDPGGDGNAALGSAGSEDVEDSPTENRNADPSSEPSIDPPGTPVAAEKLDDSALEPDRLMAELKRAIEQENLEGLETLLPDARIDPAVRRRLQSMLSGDYRLDPDQPMVEVGELSLNKKVRWALNLLDSDSRKKRVLFDLERGEDRKWRIGKVRIPEEGTSLAEAKDAADALEAADGFLRSTLAQQFERARFYVDPAKVDDVTIAGVCILFEDGAYQLRKERPIRSVFHKGATAGFIAKVKATDNSEVGDIGITVKKAESGVWRISRIALDNLLRDYAKRLSDGDVFYTPLVKNPEGGSSLALYFGFDDAQLSERSLRQLKIVASMLKIDPSKELEISGHTDGLGSEDYNLALSKRRAAAVRVALIGFGVLPEQVKIKALGQSQPRRPNFLEDGRDNESGRRVNRRAEVYLDF